MKILRFVAVGVAAIMFCSALVFPGVVGAQSDLGAQIQQLLQIVQSLQAQVAAQSGGGGGGGLGTVVSGAEVITQTSSCFKFNKNLRVGDYGADVATLASDLYEKGFLSDFNRQAAAVEFDEKIAAAVVEFQEKYAAEILKPYGLKKGTGYVGPSTRAKLNKLFACQSMPAPRSATVIDQPTYAVSSPSTMTRGGMYEFSANVTDAAPNSPVLLYLQRPDGSMKYNGTQVGSTDSRGLFLYSSNQKVTSEGKNGRWVSWVSVGGVSSNLQYHDVLGESGAITPTTPPVISLSSPQEGTFLVGQSYHVIWRTSGASTEERNVLIRLRSESSGQEYNVGDLFANSGSATVTIDSSIPTGNYKLEVKVGTEGGSYISRSAGVFQVIPTPSIPTTPATYALSINTITPSSGMANDTVAIYGTGMNDSMTVQVGTLRTAPTTVSRDGTLLTFYIPSVDPGVHEVKVLSGETQSNALNISVAAGTSTQKIETRPVSSDRTNAIQNLYRTLLYREADIAGLNYWFVSSLSIDEIKWRFMNSAEYRRTDPIAKLIKKLLNREPSSSEVNRWYHTAYSIDQMQEKIKESDEYIKLQGGISGGGGGSGVKALVCGTLGDANGDSVISQADSNLIRSIVLGNQVANSSERAAADVNGDGNVSTLDIAFITAYLNGARTTFPGCATSTTTYPGFYMSLDKTKYSLGDTVRLNMSRGDGRSDPFLVDLYSDSSSNPLNNERILLQANIPVSRNTVVNIDLSQNFFSRHGEGDYLLLICYAGQACRGGVNTNSKLLTISSIRSTVSTPSPIIVTSPSAGQFLKVGSTVNIRWENYSGSDPLTIALRSETPGGDVSIERLSSVPSTSRSYNWIVGYANANNRYQIEIYPETGRELVGRSSGYFTIDAQSTMGSPISLSKVEIDPIDGKNLKVTYSKTFDTCGHLKTTDNALVHTNNFFCESGSNITVTQPLSSFTNVKQGTRLKLCHGNNGNLCSDVVGVIQGDPPSSYIITASAATGDLRVNRGAAVVRIGSYKLTAAQNESVTVSNITVQMSSGGSAFGQLSSDFQNLRVKVGDAQFGGTQATLAYTGSYSFAGTPFTVPAGGAVYVDVYADVRSNAALLTHTPLTQFSGCSAVGNISLQASNCGVARGQNVVVTGPSIQPSITVLSPNGGEKKAAGMTLDVSWLSRNVSSYAGLNIELQKGGNVVKVFPGYANNGKNTIFIPEDMTPGSDYKVGIAYGSVRDSSDSYFTIASPTEAGYDACRLDKLDGSNITRNAITSQSACLVSLCDIYGSANLSNGLESKCVFQGNEIKRYTSSSGTDVSSIRPSITLTSPNGGERFNYGDRLSVKWDYSGFGKGVSYVDVYMVPQDGRSELLVATNYVVTDNSNVEFIVQKEVTLAGGEVRQTQFLPGNYKVRVVCQRANPAPNNQCNDTSDGAFTIVSPTVTPSAAVSNRTPVLSSVSGPSSLFAGRGGVWSITGYDPDGMRITYAITWGDNTTSDLVGDTSVRGGAIRKSFSHAYRSAGTYTIQFGIEDANGEASSIQTRTVTVSEAQTSENKPPAFKGDIKGEASLVAGRMGSWMLSAFDPDGRNLTFSANYGDGSPVASVSQVTSVDNVSTEGIFSHAFRSSGVYTITFTVTDSSGASAVQSLRVIVGAPVEVQSLSSDASSGNQVNSYPGNQVNSYQNKAPAVKRVSGQESLNVGQSGTWVVSAFDPDGTVITFSADYGDQSPSEAVKSVATSVSTSIEGTFTHSFAAEGTYTITFKVKDVNGETAEYFYRVKVEAPATSQAATFEGMANMLQSMQELLEKLQNQ